MTSNHEIIHPSRRSFRALSWARWALSLVLLAPVALAQTPTDSRPSFPVNEAAQATIREALAADESGRAAALEKLRGAVREPAALIPQLVYFSAHASNTRDGMAAGGLLTGLQFSEREIIQALIPLLGVDDARFQKSARGILGALEGRTDERTPDFSIYRDFVEDALRANQQPPEAFIRYLYEADPGQALLLMMRASGVRDPQRLKAILWAEHTVADTLWRQRFGFLQRHEALPAALQEIEKLAGDRDWWARLYAAAVIRQHSALRPKGALEALRADPHPLVRDLASEPSP